MGWRADQAYEDAQREAFLEWRGSLTWGEWFRWQAARHSAFVLGATIAALAFWLLRG